MAPDKDVSHFDPSLGCLLDPSLDALATQLSSIDGLRPGEARALLAATRESLLATLHTKLGRLLLLELNAARVTQRLDGEDAQQRWAQFIELSSRRAFWNGISQHYPGMLDRVGRIVSHRCDASLRLAQRWASDRAALAPLCGGSAPDDLDEISFGAGDSHRGGQTVALLRCGRMRLVYKPRSVAVDIALRGFVETLSAAYGETLPIRTPLAVERDGYGWTEFIEHRYADGDAELRSFYRGIGHWLAVMRLLGGSDLHAENLIAHGPSPVVIDCETLFTPRVAPTASGFGEANDRAAQLISATVLNVGLLPGRGLGLGWRGVDSSATGSLPGQQPMMKMPGIVDGGSDVARLGTTWVQSGASQNHPSPEPALATYWPHLLEGFDEITATLQRVQREGRLRAWLEPFAECAIRVVPRATEVYGELMRMLWHPVSLHKPAEAQERARDLLARMAANISLAPSDPAVIEGEIADMLDGDVPFFTTRVREGQLHGPRDTRWLPARDLAQACLQDWLDADFELERNVIRASLVSAYINDGWVPSEVSLLPAAVRAGELDARRRRHAARILEQLVANVFRGSDGSVTWIAPVLNPTGWAVQPIEQDLYGGISGVALLAAAYLRETQAGRADPVEGLQDLLTACLVTLRMAEAKRAKLRAQGTKFRPPPPGGYIGLGSQIWTYLLLSQWGMDGGDGVAQAEALAEQLPDAVEADEIHDLLLGTAGAIVPLLALARRTGKHRYLDMACEFGDRVCERAQRDGDRLFWTHGQWPEGVGGFAHGATGIAWALTKLARETGLERYREAAAAAFAFEDSLFDENEQAWRDKRMTDQVHVATAWCHGSVGIGLAHADLDPQASEPRTRDVLRHAAGATWRQGLGWNHCPCHGDLGSWELLDHAIRHGLGPEGVASTSLLELILTSIEDNGPVCGLARDAFAPGLMPGQGGIAYQLLRAHPETELPSILVPGGGLH